MTSIPFADVAWPVVTGCSKISAGCRQCYAARLAATRLSHHKHYRGLAEYKDGAGHWIAPPRFNTGVLDAPLHWRKPRTVFVAHTGDLFHKYIGWGQVLLMWDIMKRCPQHTFLVFTKRWARAQETLSHPLFPPTLPNVQLIFSASTQAEVDECAPILLNTPAAVRGFSLEPLLETINLNNRITGDEEYTDFLRGLRGPTCQHRAIQPDKISKIDRVITGGETALRKALARPCPVGPVRSLQKQCDAAGVPFWFKGWGAHLPQGQEKGTLDGVRYEEC